MILTNIVGGLGNQMFQYAFGRAMSLRLGIPQKVVLDQFDIYPGHNGFELDKVFSLSVCKASRQDLVSALGWRASPRIRRLIGRFPFSFFRGKAWINEEVFLQENMCLSDRGVYYFQGYWQSESYFSDISAELRRDFVFTTSLSEGDKQVISEMALQPSASLHVRRGDYTKGKFKSLYAQCDLNYYKSAVAYLREREAGVRIFAFSDDPDWVVDVLRPELGEVDVVKHNRGLNSVNDMRLMACANHHIIANSTFSWWAAWLNDSPDKIVVAPSKWFLSGASDAGLIPVDWVRM